MMNESYGPWKHASLVKFWHAHKEKGKARLHASQLVSQRHAFLRPGAFHSSQNGSCITQSLEDGTSFIATVARYRHGPMRSMLSTPPTAVYDLSPARSARWQLYGSPR